MAVSEWDQRQLCADDRCIGVIGSEGTCKVCGRAAANWGDERTRGLIAASQDDADEGEDEDDGDGDEDREGDATESTRPGHAAAIAGSPAWSTRALCPNDTCIGVIGESGRCKVCGQSAPADASPALAEFAAPGATADSIAPAAPTAAPAARGASPATAEDRERCADPRCTGLIAADGRCEVCGKGAS